MIETANRLIVIDGIYPHDVQLSERVLCEGGKMLVDYESKNVHDTGNYN